MDNKKDKRSFEELDDDALDAVSGGAFEVDSICTGCNQYKKVMLYQYEQKGKSRLLCRECITLLKATK